MCVFVGVRACIRVRVCVCVSECCIYIYLIWHKCTYYNYILHIITERRGHDYSAHARHHNHRGAARAAGRHDSGHGVQPAPVACAPRVLCQSAADYHLWQAAGYVL